LRNEIKCKRKLWIIKDKEEENVEVFVILELWIGIIVERRTVVSVDFGTRFQSDLLTGEKVDIIRNVHLVSFPAQTEVSRKPILVTPISLSAIRTIVCNLERTIKTVIPNVRKVDGNGGFLE
jgi:hypothetical protein